MRCLYSENTLTTNEPDTTQLEMNVCDQFHQHTTGILEERAERDRRWASLRDHVGPALDKQAIKMPPSTFCRLQLLPENSVITNHIQMLKHTIVNCIICDKLCELKSMH